MAGAVRIDRDADGDVRQALRASQERYRILVDHMPLALVVFGRDFRITEWNPAATRTFGWTEEEVVGLNATFLVPHEVRPHVGEVWRALVEGSGGSVSLNENVTKDGRRILCEWRNTRLVASDGSTIGVSSTVEDVTDRKRAEDALRRSEARFRTLIEAAPDIIGVTSEGRYAYVNPAFVRYLGYPSAAAIVGRRAEELVPPEDRASADAPGTQEVRLVRADGAIVTCEVISIPLEFDGRAAVLSMARDVTERKRMQATLLQSDRMASLGTLVAGLAHEINNPLAYVKANLDVVAVRSLPQLLTRLRALEESIGSDEAASYQLVERVEQVESMIDLAREGAERMRSIVSDLKTFSRGDDGPPLPVDLERVIDASVKMAWSEIRNRARLVKTYSAVPPIRANESRLGQVFLNLLVNAAQSIEEGHAMENTIRVRTFAESADVVVVEVADTGCGIPDEVVDRIFDPFFTTKPVGVGTGLGLWICQGIVAGLGGQIHVASRAGHGTTVSLRLPVGLEGHA